MMMMMMMTLLFHYSEMIPLLYHYSDDGDNDVHVYRSFDMLQLFVHTGILSFIALSRFRDQQFDQLWWAGPAFSQIWNSVIENAEIQEDLNNLPEHT